MRIVFFAILLNFSNVICELRRKRQSICPGNSFRCTNGKCIPSTSVCDGAVDCKDHSDETLAVCDKLSLQCPAFAFRCAYGACVDKSTKCNGIQDCADNSDELLPECIKQNASINNALCKKHEFSCDSGQCIDEVSLCDGFSDCIDGSDETITQCINIRCPAYTFQCAYGGCIDKSKKCDDKEDCKDGSDEDSELCKTHRPPPAVVPDKPKPVSKPRPPNLSGGCPLPEKPEGGDYEVNDCTEGDFSSKCRKVAGTIVRPNVIILYSCTNGFVLSENINHSFCRNGFWYPEPPQCQRLCKGLHSDSLDLTCFYHGKEVDCNQPAKPETQLQAKCKNTYHISDPSTSFTSSACLPDGTWTSELFRCVPDCGIRNAINEVTPAISFGVKANESEFPWHAGIYLIDASGKVNYICGGSIVHPKAILTAAHCVYNDTIKKKTSENQLRVAVGKYRSSWYVEDSTEQRFEVKGIIVQSKYVGKHNRYEQDIAILDLNKLIILSSSVMPICFDRDESLGLYRGPEAVGTVVGWGKTESDLQSDVLLVARFPTFGFHACREKVGNQFSLYITYDKFCAGLENGTSVQQGDSGGGLTFPRFDRGIEQHFIYGIVSLKPTTNNTIAAFTNVTDHIAWIDKVLNAIQRTKLLN